MSDGVVHDYEFIRSRIKELGLDPFAKAIAEKNAPKPTQQVGVCTFCKDNSQTCDGSCTVPPGLV